MKCDCGKDAKIKHIPVVGGWINLSNPVCYECADARMEEYKAMYESFRIRFVESKEAPHAKQP